MAPKEKRPPARERLGPLLWPSSWPFLSPSLSPSLGACQAGATTRFSKSRKSEIQDRPAQAVDDVFPRNTVPIDVACPAMESVEIESVALAVRGPEYVGALVLCRCDLSGDHPAGECLRNPSSRFLHSRSVLRRQV